MDKIIEMNSETLENENSVIRVGDKLIITVPEPELSVERMEQNYYEEIYDADVIYVDEDSWYTYQTEVLQQPSAGFRKIVADVSYLNDKEISREILKEEIVMEAVPKRLPPLSSRFPEDDFPPALVPERHPRRERAPIIRELTGLCLQERQCLLPAVVRLPKQAGEAVTVMWYILTTRTVPRPDTGI